MQGLELKCASLIPLVRDSRKSPSWGLGVKGERMGSSLYPAPHGVTLGSKLTCLLACRRLQCAGA